VTAADVPDVDPRKLHEAVAVCAAFNLIDRMADSLSFEVPPAESFAVRADKMLAARYTLPD
jgi:hypothetical protein